MSALLSMLFINMPLILLVLYLVASLLRSVKSGVLAIREYKTSKTNGDINITLDPEMTNDIKRLTSDGRKYLFVNIKGDPLSSSSFTHKLNRIFMKRFGVPISSTLIRKKGAGAWKLWREYAIAAVTPSASAVTFSALDDVIAEILSSDIQIGASTHNAEGFEVHISGGDF
jgi:integrase